MIKNNSAVIELHYLPCIQYFQVLNNYQNVYIDLTERFYKQTYRNRCKIKGANKIDQLIIPIITNSKGASIRDITIDYNQTWLKDHTRGIISAYGRAPFYEHFAEYYMEIFHKKPKHLVDLNEKLLSLCLTLLELETNIHYATTKEELPENSYSDYRGKIHPKKNFTEYGSQPYQQVFGSDFASNLSIVDLLMCEGGNSTAFL